MTDVIRKIRMQTPFDEPFQPCFTVTDSNNVKIRNYSGKTPD